MINLYKYKNKFYMQLSDMNTTEFNLAILNIRKYNFSFETGLGYTSSNPKILMDCFYELGDNFETFCDEKTKKDIEEFNPYIPKFKKIRLDLNEDFFAKWPAKGQYQIDDIKKMVQYGHILNANKQGTGKTFETVQTINNLFYNNLADRVFIVVIPTMMFSWKRALLEEFSNYFEEKDILIVTEENRDVFINCESLPKVVITSYNTYRLSSDCVWKNKNPYTSLKESSKKTQELKKKYGITDLEKLSKKVYNQECSNYRNPQIDFSKWGTKRIFIADEAHRLVNRETRWTQITLKEISYFDYVYLLTGTPHPKGIQDLYCPLKLIDSNLVDDNYVTFLHTLGNLGNGYSNYVLDSIDPEKAEKFQKRIEPYIIRHTLRDVVDLPSIDFKRVYMNLDDRQKNIYQAIVNDQVVSLKKEHGLITYGDVIVKFPFLMEALSNPCLIKDKILLPELNNWKFEDSIKYKYTKMIVEDEFEYDKNQKIIIWEEHPETIDALGKSLEKYNPVIIHGSSTPSNKEKFAWRDEQINEVFKKDKTRRILIANPATVGTGSNLQFCKTIIYFSRSFNFVDYDQSYSRTERIGMIEGVTYYLLLVDKSLDIHCDSVLSNRKLLDDLFLKKNLTQNDCKNIFAGLAKVA